MNKRWIALAALAACTTLPALAQDSGNWIVRGRVLHLNSANTDETGLGLDLSVEDKTFPELDVTYFFSPNLAVELVLTYPQEHDVYADDTVIGSLKQLPPTVSLQYHFPTGSVRPYVGVGLNYTHISDVELPEGVTVDNDSFGLALGAGVDVPVGAGWLVNFDVKKVQIETDITAGSSGGAFKIDPWLFSLGFGKRF